MTCLQVALRAHVVVDLVKVKVQLLSIENVLALKAGYQPGLLHQFHLAAQLLVAEDLVDLKCPYVIRYVRSVDE